MKTLDQFFESLRPKRESSGVRKLRLLDQELKKVAKKARDEDLSAMRNNVESMMRTLQKLKSGLQ